MYTLGGCRFFSVVRFTSQVMSHWRFCCTASRCPRRLPHLGWRRSPVHASPAAGRSPAPDPAPGRVGTWALPEGGPACWPALGALRPTASSARTRTPKQ